ncbi:MAG: hypothetical protein ABIJ91_00430, partial [Candidatus Kuenenbacteria bacterium]
MLKKRKIVFILLILVAIIGAAGAVFKYDQKKKDEQFLSNLQGEVVFTRRDKDGVSNIWKINANGTGEKMLFHNGFNDFKTDSRFPQWSDDGNKIYFISFDKDKKKYIYEMDLEGEN